MTAVPDSVNARAFHTRNIKKNAVDRTPTAAKPRQGLNLNRPGCNPGIRMKRLAATLKGANVKNAIKAAFATSRIAMADFRRFRLTSLVSRRFPILLRGKRIAVVLAIKNQTVCRISLRNPPLFHIFEWYTFATAGVQRRIPKSCRQKFSYTPNSAL